jgi:hypothetical protein
MITETAFWMLGDLYTFKQTTPELTVVEVKTFPQNGPPLRKTFAGKLRKS